MGVEVVTPSQIAFHGIGVFERDEKSSCHARRASRLRGADVEGEEVKPPLKETLQGRHAEGIDRVER